MNGIWVKHDPDKTVLLRSWAKCVSRLTDDVEMQTRCLLKYANLIDAKSRRRRKAYPISFERGLNRCKEDLATLVASTVLADPQCKSLFYQFADRFEAIKSKEVAYSLLKSDDEDCNRYLTDDNVLLVCELCVKYTFILVVTDTILCERSLNATYGDFGQFLCRNITFGDYIYEFKSKFHRPINN